MKCGHVFYVYILSKTLKYLFRHNVGNDTNKKPNAYVLRTIQQHINDDNHTKCTFKIHITKIQVDTNFNLS